MLAPDHRNLIYHRLIASAEAFLLQFLLSLAGIYKHNYSYREQYY